MTHSDPRSLFAVVFEVKPHAARMDDYLHIAAGLRPELAKVRGFVENERFRSRSRPGVLLSLSLWDDEKALVRWRALETHRSAQHEGRDRVFEDYHLRVGEVTRVTGPFADREVGWMRHDATEVGQSRTLTVVDGVLSAPLRQFIDAGLSDGPHIVGHDHFDHLSEHDRSAIVVGWNSSDAAHGFAEQLAARATQATRLYTIRVIRDYGLRDRREAPQFSR